MVDTTRQDRYMSYRNKHALSFVIHFHLICNCDIYAIASTLKNPDRQNFLDPKLQMLIPSELCYIMENNVGYFFS